MISKKDRDISSDCFVHIDKTVVTGIQLALESKVDSMYGNSIRALVKDMCEKLGVKNVIIRLQDAGALPFVLAARLESALKMACPGVTNEYLLPVFNPMSHESPKNRRRRTRLYLPGNIPKYFINAGLHKSDGVILDLEDSVPSGEKQSARYLVRNALRGVHFLSSERMVRINQGPEGIKDLEFVVPHFVETILIPKCETPDDVQTIEEATTSILKRNGLNHKIWFVPIIESAKGVMNSYAIAKAGNNICALAIGLEDYTADLGVERTKGGRESLFARQMIINAAKAVGIQPLDSVFSLVDDDSGLRESVLEAKSLGFEGKGCIHPRQIRIIHDTFAPSVEEIEWAQKTILAFEGAQEQGIGVLSLESSMIDSPVIKRAQRIIDLAKSDGSLNSLGVS